MTDTIPATVKTHTALPWAQSHRRKRTGMYSTQVYCADGETIAEIDWYPRPAGNGAVSTYREANAAFIVRACNNHYQLLSALREAIEELWDRDHSSMDRIQFERANASLFAALSQAGGASD